MRFTRPRLRAGRRHPLRRRRRGRGRASPTHAATCDDGLRRRDRQRRRRPGRRPARRLRARSSPRSTVGHRLGQATTVRTFQKQKYSDVVVDDRPRGRACGPRSTDTKVKFDYLIQTTTNYAFLDEIAFRTGFEWRVDGQDADLQAAQHDGGRSRSRTARTCAACKARFTAASEATDVDGALVGPADEEGGRRARARWRTPAARARPAARSGLGDGGRTKAKAFAGTLGASTLIATSSDEATQIAEALGGTGRAPPTSTCAASASATRRSRPASTVEIDERRHQAQRHVLRHVASSTTSAATAT